MNYNSMIVHFLKIKLLFYKIVRRLLAEFKQQEGKTFNKKVFKNIYDNNLFHRGEVLEEVSRSGPGSDLIQTKEIRKQLPYILSKYSIQSLLDIPCGDFYWMKKVNLKGVKYIGGDIVDELIKENQKYSSGNIQFKILDILEDKLPAVDLIFCRDLFVHLQNDQIMKAIHNIKSSGSKYLLTTSFKGRGGNPDIAAMGKWRPLNLEISPFNFPLPIDEIFEDCQEDNLKYNDKYLLLFEIAHL